jgi:membrane protein implicated in regulation of membrane protease activity
MIELANLWRDLWPELLRWGGEIVTLVRTLHPGLLVALAAPVVLALLFRSLTAALLGLVLAVMALFAFRVGADDLFRCTFTVLTVLAGLLAVVLAAMLRRRRRQLRQMDERMDGLRQDLADLNRKYEGEVHWRRAAERMTAKEAG